MPRPRRLLPLGAASLLAATAHAQTPPASVAEPTLAPIPVRAAAEPTAKETLNATDTRIGRGRQELRDLPQSLTVVTEKLIDDRNLETLRDALRNTAGISFLAAEGGEEDIRLRGFSLQASGDIFIDGMRDGAFYERDSFNWDRLEVLRGSASMLFGRGSTGGAVNQVSKQPRLVPRHEITLGIDDAEIVRATGDFNLPTGENAAFRVNTMVQTGERDGIQVDKRGIAPTLRWGIGTRDEFSAGLFHLVNDNGIDYGLPWLAPGAAKGGNWLWPTAPGGSYALASDRANTQTTQGHLVHTHRFGGDAEWRTALRVARSTRDQRASAVRFCTQGTDPLTGAVSNPECPVEVTADNFGRDTILRRSGDTGVQLKVGTLETKMLQSDYSATHRWGGFSHAIQAGGDLADERFSGSALDPTSPVLTKPRTTVGTPADGASVAEGQRVLVENRNFDNQALGLYLQDLVQIAPAWKLLAGLRWDRVEGRYRSLVATGGGGPGGGATNPCAVTAPSTLSRSDSLWSRRFGVLWQPSEKQSFHVSYGTSFNTSGDAYQYDAGTANTPPEGSRNVEVGARFESASGDLSTRVALFHSTKTNERNRDADAVDACNYVLSGKRHAAGVELDVSGRLAKDWEVYVSLAFIPDAEVDASSGAQGTEVEGSRSGLTPRVSGTVWTTWQATPKWRLGGGVNLRSRDRPVGLAADSRIEAPAFVTADAMLEYAASPTATVKLNVNNLADRHVADVLYRGHYIPGKPRTVALTTSFVF
jgi:catecholate siderophore receptor